MTRLSACRRESSGFSSCTRLTVLSTLPSRKRSAILAASFRPVPELFAPLNMWANTRDIDAETLTGKEKAHGRQRQVACSAAAAHPQIFLE
jgi:hypothetical protein